MKIGSCRDSHGEIQLEGLHTVGDEDGGSTPDNEKRCLEACDNLVKEQPELVSIFEGAAESGNVTS
jgi:hypothetical protein